MTTRLPNFVYIGPSKAGSTWLHEVLIQHPQVYLTEAKDLYFFDRYFDRGVDWYAAYFRDARPQHKVVGEVCQEYLSSADAPARMRSVLGADVRLMVTLRDPVTWAFSAYLYLRKHNVFAGSFREALETRPGMLHHNRYATLLERYLEHYDRSAIHCAVFDDLVQSPQHFIDEVLATLAIDPMPLDEPQFAARLPASRARSKHLAGMVKRGANWARRHRSAALIGRVKRSPLLQRALYVPLRDKPALPPEDAAYIQERLGADVARLERLVGLDLRTRWGWPT